MPIRPKMGDDWSEETREDQVAADEEADPKDQVPPADDQPGLDPPIDEPAEG